jgi:5-methylcytosine-specific restriction protein A
MSNTHSRHTGRTLSKLWGIKVQHALYRENGTWYHHLEHFPGALFDANGYILFQTEDEYRSCKYLQLGKELSVPKGISSIPGYIKVTADVMQEASDVAEPEPTSRVTCTVNRIIRDTALSRKVKSLYRSQCQICRLVLQLHGGQSYAEAHHIKPLGSKHNGPDVVENIICVCPNCHAQLDFGGIEIDKRSLLMVPGHSIAEEYISYHNSRIYKGARTIN